MLSAAWTPSYSVVNKLDFFGGEIRGGSPKKVLLLVQKQKKSNNILNISVLNTYTENNK